MSLASVRERQVHAGARIDSAGETEIVRDYGDGDAEYRAIREEAGVVARDDRAQLRMWGRDPARMLNGLITNDLGRLEDGQTVQALMLTPKGRIISDLRVLRWVDGKEGELLIDIPADALSTILEHLKKYVPPLFARWEVITDGMGALGIYGPNAPTLVSRAIGLASALEEGESAEADVGHERVFCVATKYAGGEAGFDVFGNEAGLTALWDELANGDAVRAHPVGHTALEVLRIEEGRPRYGKELTEEVLPAEAFGAGDSLGRWISFTKGCYTGQEVVVRIAHRGHVNRHLRGLLLGERGPRPVEGTPLMEPDGGKEVGRITSVSRSPRLEQDVALGYVRREITPGSELRIGAEGGATATVVELPFPR
ncbi:MAG: hypothetical protein GEU90_09765 [Gemmatimonas sp.]|nr:hypothetical protein [Gemmatimonas sp.]